jgi:uncharacterized membrane protein YjfL (UPF0719 family)
MSSDEHFILLVSALATLLTWIAWYRRLFWSARFAANYAVRQPLLLAPPLCALFLFAILRRYASHDVREDPAYLAFYMALGGAWVGIFRCGYHFLGLSMRDDVVERRNPAAAAALSGGLAGLTLCYAGGNIGDGPGWWVVVYCAALSSVSLYGLWVLLERITGLADRITIERDFSAGLRTGGFFLACGLILGRAVAGHWESGMETLRDFGRTAWPALMLVVMAALAEWAIGRVSHRADPGALMAGWIPALCFLLFGVAALYFGTPWL